MAISHNNRQNNQADTIKCYGCGALVDELEGRPHKYIGASQGCWNLYTEVLAKEYGDYRYFNHTHRLTVDTYAIQHPGQPTRQSIQSVNIHLISLYAVLVKKMDGEAATELIGMILADNPAFKWLEPPMPNGILTVADVLKANSNEEHVNLVQAWAQDVFGCWFSKHGEEIKKLSAIIT